MLIKIFGIVIATGADKKLLSPVTNAPAAVVSQTPAVVEETITGKELVVVMKPEEAEEFRLQTLFDKVTNPFSNLHPITKSINWPNPGDDPFKITVFRKAILDFDRCAKFGFFSICAIDKLQTEMGLISSIRAEATYKKLISIHCCRWSSMEPDLLKIMPALISEVLTSVIPNESNDKDWTKFKY